MLFIVEPETHRGGPAVAAAAHQLRPRVKVADLPQYADERCRDAVQIERRPFSGDGKQRVPLLQAALAHRSSSLIDIVSTCATFDRNNG